MVFGLLTKPLVRLMLPSPKHLIRILSSEPTTPKSFVVPLLGNGEATEADTEGQTVRRPTSLRMLLSTPTHTVHHYWRRLVILPFICCRGCGTRHLFSNMDNSPTTGSVSTTAAEKRQLAKASLAFNYKSPIFRKMFPEYVEKYNEQQLAEQSVSERAPMLTPPSKDSVPSPATPRNGTRQEVQNREEMVNDVITRELHILASSILYGGFRLPPWIAGAAMAAFSVSVVCCSLLLKNYNGSLLCQNYKNYSGSLLCQNYKSYNGSVVCLLKNYNGSVFVC